LKVVLGRMLTTPARNEQHKALRRFVEHVILWWVDFAAGSIPDDDSDTPLFADFQSIETANMWIQIGQLCHQIVLKYDEASLEERGLENSLRQAAAAGQAPRVKAFLAMGISCFGSGKKTAMDVAILAGHAAVARVIAEFIGPMPPFNGCRQPLPTPGLDQHLFQAALYENEQYAVAALAAKADPNKACGSKEKSALMTFAAAGNLEICQRLLESKADACAEDAYGCRASNYALALGHEAISVVLETQETRKSRPRLPKLGDPFANIAREGCAGSVWRWANEKKAGTSLCITPSSVLNVRMEGGFAPTALLIAVEQFCKEDSTHIDPSGQVYRSLLYWKADPAITDSRRETPLHAAALRENIKVFSDLYEALIALHGEEEADWVITNQENQFGQTPNSLLQNREFKIQCRQDNTREENERMLRFVFLFWGTWRQSLAEYGWRERWDRRQNELSILGPEKRFSEFVLQQKHMQSASDHQSALAADKTKKGYPHKSKSESAAHHQHHHQHQKHGRHASPGSEHHGRHNTTPASSRPASASP